VSRQIKRSMLKTEYERFCRAWDAEKTFQRISKEAGQPLPEGVNILGRKPTFAMWKQARDNKVFEQKQEEKKVEVVDPTWED
jgi:hypothetical protein